MSVLVDDRRDCLPLHGDQKVSASPEFPGLPIGWSEEILKTQDERFSIRFWSRAQSTAKQGLFVVHGFGEQSSRYEHFPHYLRSEVDFVAAIDLLGHGLSTGVRGHCDSFEQVLAGCLAAIDRVKAHLQQPTSTHQKSIIHWFSHSFGSLVGIHLLAKMPAQGFSSAAICAPLMGLSMPVPPVKKFFGELVAAIPGLASLPLKNEINPLHISHDLSVSNHYSADPLNHDKITPRMFVEMTQAMNQSQKTQVPDGFPTLLFVPQDDKIVNAATTLAWAREQKLKLISWPGAYHELFNDTDKALAFNALSNWLKAH